MNVAPLDYACLRQRRLGIKRFLTVLKPDESSIAHALDTEVPDLLAGIHIDECCLGGPL